MFHQITTSIAFCILLIFSSETLARRIDIPLTVQETQLLGLNAEARFPVVLDAPKDRTTEPKLIIAWAKSRLVDARRSTVSVVIDGRVLHSVWLADLAEGGEYAVPLNGLVGGTHIVSIRSSMWVEDDPCLQRYRNDAWFTIKPTSRISWERSVSASSRVAVNSLPDSWLRLAEGTTGIFLDYQALLDKQGVGAYLDANQLLRHWGYQPEKNRTDRTVGQLRLITLDRLDTKSETALRFIDSPETRFALAVDNEGVLNVVGRDSTSLREGVLFLADANARALCTGPICSSGLQLPQPKPALLARPKVDKNDPSQVWKLGTSGYPNGWQARGGGQHALRFVWQRPATWRVRESPTLFLHANVSGSAALDQQQSAITVRINERPVATYSLGQWSTGQAQIRIPRDLWGATEWVFDVVAILRPTDVKACSISEQDTAWVTISPETALIVPAQEQPFEGVASFFKEMNSTGLPGLSIENPSLEQLALVATMVYPFIQSKPNNTIAPPRQWKIVDEQACELQHCIRVQREPPADSPLKLNKGQWRNSLGELHVPHIDVVDTAGLFYLPQVKARPSQLVIVAGATSTLGGVTDPPDYLGLIGRIALFSQRWHVLDIRLEGQEAAAALSQSLGDDSKDSNNISKEQSNLRWLNFLWAAISLLVIAGLLIRLWRRPASKKHDVNWEIHS